MCATVEQGAEGDTLVAQPGNVVDRAVCGHDQDRGSRRLPVLVPGHRHYPETLSAGNARIALFRCDREVVKPEVQVRRELDRQAEVEENELAAPRPFRVNAGALSLYTLAPGNRTMYLEEVRSGDEVLLVERDGKSRVANVARSKIEVRPLLLVEAKSEDGRSAIAILQNAETIRLVTDDSSIPVTELKVGDKVLAHFEKGGRHFGTLIEKETIIER